MSLVRSGQVPLHWVAWVPGTRLSGSACIMLALLGRSEHVAYMALQQRSRMMCILQGTSQTSPSPPPSAAATDEDRGETKRARQRKRKDPEVVDERTMRMQKRMVGSSKFMFSRD